MGGKGNTGESRRKENGKQHGNWDYMMCSNEGSGFALGGFRAQDLRSTRWGLRARFNRLRS